MPDQLNINANMRIDRLDWDKTFTLSEDYLSGDLGYNIDKGNKYAQLDYIVNDIGTVDVKLNPNTGSNEILINAEGHECPENTTSIPLSADEVFIGTSWQDALDYGNLTVSVVTDVDSAEDGLEVQWSYNGIDVIDNDVFTIIGGKSKSFTFGPTHRYYRISYTNGPSAQSDFHLTSVLRKTYVKPSSHRIADPIVADDDAELVKAVVTGIKPDGTFTNANLTQKSNLKVSISEYEDTTAIDAFDRLRVSNPYTLFDSKQLHDKQPLFWDEVVNGTASSVHLSADACTMMSVSANGDYVIRQSKQRINYQPGKAIGINEPVLTTYGYKKISDLNIGEEVFDGRGAKTKVIGIADWKKRPTYRVTMDDGQYVDVDIEHDWTTIKRTGKNKGDRLVVSTREMLKKYNPKTKFSADRYRIPATPVLEFPKIDVPVDPYILGCILGDGNVEQKGFVQFTTADEEILDYIKCDKISKYGSKYHYGLCGLGNDMRNLNLNGKTFIDKCVPELYKFNYQPVRLSILQGLMDTDGTVDKRTGDCEFNTGSKQLAEDVEFLVRSLGGQTKTIKGKAGYKDSNGIYIPCADSYRIRIIMRNNPFRMKRKADLWKPRTRISFDRYIHSIEYIGDTDTRCIEVASDDHNFITRGGIVTHNSQQMLMTFHTEQDANVRKRVGQFTNDGGSYLTVHNGIYFEVNGTDISWNISKAGVLTERILQEDWNVDPMDGTGPSLLTLDVSAPQIIIIDYEWLGIGRVRVGFVINGLIVYVHYFNHANNPTFDSVYMSTPNLPLRYDIYSYGGSGNMDHICSSVMSEGGIEENGVLRSFNTGMNFINANTPGTTYAILGIKLKSVYRDITVTPKYFSMLNAQSGAYKWSIRFNPTVSGTFTYTDQTNSALQLALGDTAGSNTVTGGIEIDSGFISASLGANGQSGSREIATALRMGSNIDGTLDSIVLCVTPIGANADIYGALTVRELL